MEQECLPSEKFSDLGSVQIPIIEVSSEIMAAVKTMVSGSQMRNSTVGMMVPTDAR